MTTENEPVLSPIERRILAIEARLAVVELNLQTSQEMMAKVLYSVKGDGVHILKEIREEFEQLQGKGPQP